MWMLPKDEEELKCNIFLIVSSYMLGQQVYNFATKNIVEGSTVVQWLTLSSHSKKFVLFPTRAVLCGV